MNSASRLLTKGSSVSLRTLVRNAGGKGPSAESPHQLPPLFPPGPRQIEQIKNWAVSLATFGAATGAGVCYFTDWRVITDWIPFYNGKYTKEE